MSTDQQFPTPANLGIAVYSNNAEAIGNTPLVRINRLIKSYPAHWICQHLHTNPPKDATALGRPAEKLTAR